MPLFPLLSYVECAERTTSTAMPFIVMHGSLTDHIAYGLYELTVGTSCFLVLILLHC